MSKWKELREDIITNYYCFEPKYFVDKYNAPISAVYRIASEEERTNKYLLKSQEGEIVKDYNNGLSVKNLRKKYGHDRKMLIKLLRANNCEIRDKVVSHQIFSFNDRYFERIDSHEKAYWLGFIYADGNIHENKLQIGLANKDIEILNNFKKDIESEHKLYKDGNDSTKLIIRSSKMCGDLNRLGVWPRKSLTLKPPTEEMVAKKFINSFLLGYFDGDGHVGVSYRRDEYKRKSWRFQLISTKEFIEYCSCILGKIIGRKGCIYKEKRTKEDVWYLTYGGDCSGDTVKTQIKLKKYLYRNFRRSLDRKKDIFKNICLAQIS